MKISSTHYTQTKAPISQKDLAKLNQSSALTKDSDQAIEALKAQPKPKRLLDLQA